MSEKTVSESPITMRTHSPWYIIPNYSSEFDPKWISHTDELN